MYLLAQLPPLGRVHVAAGGGAAAVAPLAAGGAARAHDARLAAVRPAHPHALAFDHGTLDEGLEGSERVPGKGWG